MDLASRDKWVESSRAKDEMFAHTDIKQAPWYTVEADDKYRAHLNCLGHVLRMIPYQDVTPTPMLLTPRQNTESYVRPPKSERFIVPELDLDVEGCDDDEPRWSNQAR